jgi:hypothetical protein
VEAIVIPDDGIPLGLNGAVVPDIISVYRPTAEEKLVIRQAEYEIVKACMAGKGFDYLVDPPVIEGVPTASPSFDSWLGMLDPAYARKWGYGLDPALLAMSTGSGHHNDPGDPFPAGYTEAYNGEGTDGGGCVGEVGPRMAADLPKGYEAAVEFLSDIWEDSASKTWTDPEVLAAEEVWSECMAEWGFDYAGLQELDAYYNGFEVESWLDPVVPDPSEEEKATGVADVACKKESDVFFVWRAKYWGFQLEAMEQNPLAGEIVRAATDAQVARAQQVLSELGVD